MLCDSWSTALRADCGQRGRVDVTDREATASGDCLKALTLGVRGGTSRAFDYRDRDRPVVADGSRLERGPDEIGAADRWAISEKPVSMNSGGTPQTLISASNSYARTGS
jgi:hypothetical protein